MATPEPLSEEMNTSFPFGVNFKRFAPLTFAASVSTAFLAAMSMIDTVPSCAFATQISLARRVRYRILQNPCRRESLFHPSRHPEHLYADVHLGCQRCFLGHASRSWSPYPNSRSW